MATKQPGDKWPSGAGSASGGHVTPDFTSDEAFLEALKQPAEGDDTLDFTRGKPTRPTTHDPKRSADRSSLTPRSTSSESASARRREYSDETAPLGTRPTSDIGSSATASVLDDPLQAPKPPAPRPTEPRRQERSRRAVTPRPRSSLRRVKRTLKHVDPLSVLKLSLFYYAVFLIVGLVVVAVIYSLLSSMGAFDTIEEIGRVFTLWKKIDITLFMVERWAFLIGLTLVVLASLINLCLAFLYNLGADLVGGVEVTFVERDV